jgi:hypothetical protein
MFFYIQEFNGILETHNSILGGHGFPSKGGETMELKDALTIMILFASFVLALLTYIGNNYKRK